MKLGKLGLAASAVVVMTLAAAASAQNFDDEGGRDRSWATKGQTADAQAPSAATPATATDSKDHSWKAGENTTYDLHSHSLYRATPGTGVKTPPWAAPSDMKAATNNDSTVVKTDNGWTHQGMWKGPAAETAEPAKDTADAKPSGGDAAANAVAAPDTPANSAAAPAATTAPAAPDSQSSGGATTADSAPPSMASPTP